MPLIGKPIGSPLILSGHDLADRLAFRCLFNGSYGKGTTRPTVLVNLVNGNKSSDGANSHNWTSEDGGIALAGNASFIIGTFGTDSTTADLALAPFTLMARVSNNSLSYANGIVERNDANSVNAGWMATVTSTEVGLTVEHASTNMQAFATVGGGGYYWITFVFDGSATAANQKIYINGITQTVAGTNGVGIQGSDAANSLLIGSSTFNPAGHAFSHGPWNGGMSDMSIWRRALSQGEILEYIRDPYCMLVRPSPSRRLKRGMIHTVEMAPLDIFIGPETVRVLDRKVDMASTLSKTDAISVLALQTLASNSVVISNVQDVSTKFQATLLIHFGRTVNTALTTGVIFRIEGSSRASADGYWAQLAAIQTRIVAITSQAVNGTCNSAQKVVAMTSTTGMALADYIFIKNSTLGNSEWQKVAVITTNTSVTTEDNLLNAQTGATVYPNAEVYALTVDLTAIKRIRVVVDASNTGQTIAFEVEMVTADSIG